MTDAGDLDPLDSERKNKEIEKRRQRRRDREIDDLKKVLGLVEGRRLMHRLLVEVGIYRATFDANALSMAFKEGKRDVGLFLMKDISEHCLEKYHQMQREADSEMKTDKLLLEQEQKQEEN